MALWNKQWLRLSKSNQNRSTIRQLKLNLEWLEARDVPSASWQTITPAPLADEPSYNGFVATNAGRVTGVSVDPADNNTIFIATAGGGVWKTSNGGSVWIPLTDHVSDAGGKPVVEFMGAIAETRDSGNNEIVYAGTGEANNSGDNYYGQGILVSNNGGTSWTLQNAGGAFTGLSTAKIVIDPSDPTGKTAYAAMADNGSSGFATNLSSVSVSANTGIWKTTDGGAHWINTTAVDGKNNTDTWSDLVIDTTTPSTLYAALGNSTGGANNGVYKSTNGGTNWALLPNGPTGSTVGRIELALYDAGTTNFSLKSSLPGASATSELFVSVSTTTGSPNPLQMLKSTDGGTTFTDLTTNVLAVNNYLSTQGDYDTTLAIDPMDPNYIYASGDQATSSPYGGNIESFDGGVTWKIIAVGLGNSMPHTDAHAVAFDSNGNLLEGNDGGLFRLNNPTNPPQFGNQTWESLNGNLNTLQFNSIAVDPTTPTTAYGGNQDNGSIKVFAGVTSTTEGGDGGISRLDPNHPNIVYGHVGERLEISIDSGATFNDITPAGAGSGFLPPFVVDSLSNIYYAGSGDKLYFSSNHGTTWTAIGTAANGFTASAGSVTSIAISPINNNVIYVSSAGSIFVTQNAQASVGVSWTTVNFPNTVGGFADTAPNLLAVDPSISTGGTVYAVIDNFTGLTGAGGSHHVYKSTNYGAAWTDITGNLQDTPVRSVAISPNGTTVYIGTDVGVYSSTNGGTTWTTFGSGLPNVQVTDLEIVPGQNILAAATHGRGLWEISLTVVKTTPTVNSTDSGGTYNGNPFAASATVVSGSTTVINSPDPSLTFTYYLGSTTTGSPLIGAPASVGTYTVVAHYSGNATYNNADSTPATFIITPNSITYVIKNDSQTYGSPANLATDLGVNILTGVNGENLKIVYSSNGDTAIAPVTAYDITGVLSDGTGKLSNYNVTLTKGMLTVMKATPTVTVSDAGGVFTGSAFPTTASVKGVSGPAASSLEAVTLTLTYYSGSAATGTPLSGAPSTVGTYTVCASFAGSTDYTSAKAKTTFSITQVATIASISITNAPSLPRPHNGTAPFVFTITLSASVKTPVTVQYATSDGTNADPTRNAKAGIDYLATSGTITFLPGQTSLNLAVYVKGFNQVGSSENFNLVLSNQSTNASLGFNSTATATILSNVVAPILSLSTPAAVHPGPVGTTAVVITVTLSAPSDSAVSVQYVTSNVNAGNNYIANSGILTFAAGQTTAKITLFIRGGALISPTETFLLTLSSPINAIFAGGASSISKPITII